MFNQEEFKHKVEKWLQDNPQCTLDEMRNCYQVILSEQDYLQNKWVVDDILNWYSVMHHEKKIEKQWYHTIDPGNGEIIIERLIHELSQFFGIDKREVLKVLDREIFNPSSYIAESWRKFNPKTEEEIENFNKKTDAHIYNLAIWAETYDKKKLRDLLVERLTFNKCKRVLDYGGGVGAECLEFFKKGFEVGYFDLKGKTSEFAAWRFQKEGCADKIAVYHEPEQIPKDYYEAIICIDVLEHIPNPMKTIEGFRHLLKANGIVLLAESFAANGDYPPHLATNRKYAGKIYALMGKYGFLCTYHPLSERPLEFKKCNRNFKFYVKSFKIRIERDIQMLRAGLKRLLA